MLTGVDIMANLGTMNRVTTTWAVTRGTENTKESTV